ncbi:two pore calcium channel protein 1-like isoform X2 [Prionailurus viverrinus]|uniref:two pore calcium channel protein 1-like isoform X2 n=1 Tax=Prionailurus viverrinus TaxID=61388 RepID=UPI001FF6154E|nr:two pore calcium channel protein 1-like isoform X2 [Prionailurus viverrinus]
MPGAGRAAGVRRLRPQPSEERPAQEEDQNLLLAAAYVSDAQYNRNVPFETSPRAIRLYYFYNHWTMQVAIYFFICVDLSLALFEEPALFPLPFLATSLAEVLCLTAFFGRLVHFAKVTPQMVFWKDTKNICIMVTIVLTLIDLIIYGSLEAVNIHSVRWSRALRPVFLINFPESRQIRRTFRSIRNTLPDILYVFLLFMFSVLIFSLMALKLFGDRGLKTVEGLPYFTNILDIVFELYVLVTTANSPDVMMPAYNFNWWYCLYFITYTIINTYIFMSVFLAVVYNNYRKHLKNEIRKLAYLKRHKMIEAFNILKVKVGTEFVVTESQWRRLAKVVAPHISSPHLELLLRISDEGQKGHVDKVNFLRLADLLNIQVVTINIRRHPLEDWMPRAYRSSASLLVQRMVQHRIFVWVYDVIILINAIFIALDERNPFISYAEWLFLSLYIIEILLKLYTYEPRAYFGRRQFWNWFDTLIIIAALVATVANTTIQSARKYNSQQILDIVLILRILRLLRIIVSIQRFRVIVTTLINIGPTILTFGGLVLVVYYVFAIIGMEAFHGKVRFSDPNFTSPDALVCGNPALKDSAFARDRYCKNNFNDLASSFIVLMELTVVNQWHVLAGGFALVTHQAAKLYFIGFHIVVVILIVNIFIAFILEAFFVAYSLEKSEVETAIEKKIQELGVGIQEEEMQDGKLVDNVDAKDSGFSGDGGDNKRKDLKGLYFRIASKKYRTVDALLQQMFESEIAPEEEGPSLDEILNFSPGDLYPKNPNFENSA